MDKYLTLNQIPDDLLFAGMKVVTYYCVGNDIPPQKGAISLKEKRGNDWVYQITWDNGLQSKLLSSCRFSTVMVDLKRYKCKKLHKIFDLKFDR